jgi:hypothetical protein
MFPLRYVDLDIKQFPTMIFARRDRRADEIHEHAFRSKPSLFAESGFI